MMSSRPPRPTTIRRSLGRFDLDTEFGKSAYRNTKGRRVSGLSIGYAIRNFTPTAAGNELTDLRTTVANCVRLRRRLQSLVDDRHKLIEQLLRQVRVVEDLRRKVFRGIHGPDHGADELVLPVRS
jgi:hypothetical protein